MFMYGTGAAAAVVGFRFTRNYYALAPIFFAGYVVGNGIGMSVVNAMPWSLSQPRDDEILRAFEQRYLNRSTNMAGYGNNALTAADHTHIKQAEYKKPY